MVSLFGQVWLWSLLSFVAGVLVTWLVQVRPAKQRLAEVEANRLSAPAGPARPQPQAPPSSVSSPMRDEEFDDWHVGARANSDPALAPPPEQLWPQNSAQQAPRAYEPPRPAEPYEPSSRSAEPLRPLEPQRLIEPPEIPAQEPYAPLPRTPEPRQSNDVAPYPPLSAFATAPEPEPEPDSENYDELPPALTRIPENAEPTRIVEPVDVPEEEKPRSLFQRLSTEDEVRAEPVPLNPAQEPTVFRRADLDELPDVPEIPADRTRYLNPVTADIAPVQEEPTAPPEVQEWHPREMWREEEEEQVDQSAEAEHDVEPQEAELLDDREEDFAADEVPPVEVEEPAEPVQAVEETTEDDDEAVEDESDVETTSVIPAGEVQRAIDAADARLEAERDAERQPWPEHSLTGQFPIVAVTDTIASSKGQLGVQPDDPDDRRDDPDERTTGSLPAQPAADSGPSREAETPAADSRDAESRGADFRAAQAGTSGVGSTAASPATAESRNGESSATDLRGVDARDPETRGAEFRAAQAGTTEFRGGEAGVGRPPSAPSAASAATDFGRVVPRPEEPEQATVEAPAPATEFFPVEVFPAEPLVDKRAAAPRAADFFAPQPPEAEPAAPAAKPSKPAAAQPAGERPRSLFEPIVGASDDDPEPAETARNLPPTDDQPFVPTLAPELLQRGSNGLPQRPQRPAGGPPPMTSPPLLGPPQPVAPPAAKPLPVRPRPVGFSPSTGGRSEAPPTPVAPRYQQPEGFNPRSPFGPGSVLPKSDGHAPAADFEVKATLTGRRYFSPGTSTFNATRADVWFRTEADAQKAGFRPA